MTEKEKLNLEEMMINTDKYINQKAAESLFAMYTAYKNAGFTASQSFSLVKGALEASITATITRNRA